MIVVLRIGGRPQEESVAVVEMCLHAFCVVLDTRVGRETENGKPI